jgi:hypothetical protein
MAHNYIKKLSSAVAQITTDRMQTLARLQKGLLVLLINLPNNL